MTKKIWVAWATLMCGVSLSLLLIWRTATCFQVISDDVEGSPLGVLEARWGPPTLSGEFEFGDFPNDWRRRELSSALVRLGSAQGNGCFEAVWKGVLSDRSVWFVRKNGVWVAAIGYVVGKMIVL